MKRKIASIGAYDGRQACPPRLPALATSGAPRKGGRTPLKYFLIPLVGCIVIFLVVLVLSLSLQVEIQPASFKTINITGGPGIGDYEIFFALSDADQKNGPSNGYVYLNILDRNQTVLYHSEFLIRSFHFSTYTNFTVGVPLVGYLWNVPLANVTPGIPLKGDLGKANIVFLALSGRVASGEVLIPIPIVNP